MHVIEIARTGGPEVLDRHDRPIPKPGPGEVLIKAHAIGVAYFDMLIRTGRYPWMPPLPYVPGNEMTGHIVDGNGTGLSDGQAVYVANWDNEYKGGFYAEYLAPRRRRCGRCRPARISTAQRRCRTTSSRPASSTTRCAFRSRRSPCTAQPAAWGWR